MFSVLTAIQKCNQRFCFLCLVLEFEGGVLFYKPNWEDIAYLYIVYGIYSYCQLILKKKKIYFHYLFFFQHFVTFISKPFWSNWSCKSLKQVTNMYFLFSFNSLGPLLKNRPHFWIQSNANLVLYVRLIWSKLGCLYMT